MIRRKLSIVAAVGGLFFAYMLASNFHQPTQPNAEFHTVVRFCVAALFCVPFGGTVGMGIGMLAEGISQRIRPSSPPKP